MTPVRTPSSQRVMWELLEAAKPASSKKPPAHPPAGTGRVDWAAGAEAGVPKLDGLIGVEDAFEHTPLEPGESIAFCTRDQVAYHLVTWQFLKAHNHARCCICGLPDAMVLRTLPAAPAAAPVVAVVPAAPRVAIRPGEKMIRPQEVLAYLNRSVLVESFVYEVYCSKNGTHFVRFEPRGDRDKPYAGFKLVVFKDYDRAWAAQGLRLQDYLGCVVRARGVVQQHEVWETEILVNSPRLIEVVGVRRPFEAPALVGVGDQAPGPGKPAGIKVWQEPDA